VDVETTGLQKMFKLISLWENRPMLCSVLTNIEAIMAGGIRGMAQTSHACTVSVLQSLRYWQNLIFIAKLLCDL
jgi:hypothetical protein